MHILVYYGIDILGCGALFYLLRLGKLFNKAVFIIWKSLSSDPKDKNKNKNNCINSFISIKLLKSSKMIS